ncbi:MAG: DUF2029 domain-containing protein [Sandaracinus sp.]|nr:DUF2029 domain-containing protein [Sandaracinus sp.]
MSWARRHRFDLAGFLAALVYGAPSLRYLYGPDQAMFHYVAREWLAGRLPYRDVFDVKPPGVFVLEAVLLACFGESQVVLRVVSWLAVVGTGAMAAAAWQTREERRPGALGLGAFLASAWHFGAFDFYHSAQTELFQSFFLIAGLLAARRTRPGLAGVLLGVAVLFKLTAVVPAALIGLVCFGRRPKELAKLVVGGATPLALFVASYALVDLLGEGGALESLAHYVELVAHYGTSAKPSLGARLSTFWLENVAWLLVALATTGIGWRERSTADRRQVLLGATLFVGSALAVLSQGKLSVYQWDVTSGFLVLWLLAALRPLPTRAVWGTAIVLAALPLVRPGAFYGAHVRTVLTGGAVESAMVHPDFLYAYEDQRRMAEAFEARGLRPGDALHVRGYEPTVYVLTGARSPARFFENHLHSWWVRDVEALEAAKHDHYARLADAAPRFFATRPELPVDVELLEAAGYEPFAEVGRFTLWERVRADAPAPRWPEGWWREPERRARERAEH